MTDKQYWFLCSLILLIVILCVLVPPYFECQTFNKFSKTKATYWDALWTNLRIIPD